MALPSARTIGDTSPVVTVSATLTGSVMSSQMSDAAIVAASTPTTPTKLRLSRTRLMDEVYTLNTLEAGGGSQLQHDFPELTARFEVPMRLGGFSKRERPIDNRAHDAAKEQPRGLEQLGLLAHVGTEQRELTAEQMPQIDARVVSCRASAGHEPAAFRETLHACVPRG